MTTWQERMQEAKARQDARWAEVRRQSTYVVVRPDDNHPATYTLVELDGSASVHGPWADGHAHIGGRIVCRGRWPKVSEYMRTHPRPVQIPAELLPQPGD